MVRSYYSQAAQYDADRTDEDTGRIVNSTRYPAYSLVPDAFSPAQITAPG